MLGIIAAIVFAVGFVLQIVKSDATGAFGPWGLLFLGLAIGFLHLVGIVSGWNLARRP